MSQFLLALCGLMFLLISFGVRTAYLIRVYASADALTSPLASGNPQIFQQALIIISGIAKIDSESVIQSVMPVFTFMGSNVFHRDDSFSFRVVQKVISKRFGGSSVTEDFLRPLKVLYRLWSNH